jgi:lysine 2,3-aminomutase
LSLWKVKTNDETTDLKSATLRTPAQLAAAGLIGADDLKKISDVASTFDIAISPHMQTLIDADDPADPIAAQFVPKEAELSCSPEELEDPIGDRAHTPTPGIVHRYPDRVLLKPVHACAVYCRFCFRREMLGSGAEALDEDSLELALDYIDSQAGIWEVILTGGDPLIMSPRRILRIMRRLESIGHVGVVRFHTRVPVVAPDLIDDSLIGALRIKKATFGVLHTNHVRELSNEARQACAKLVDAGIPMLSQTVLLKGVNADAQSLQALFRALVEMRIKPYYLHHGDLARGTRHFRTSIAAGQELMRSLRGHVSGLCRPEYVLDIPGGHGKVPIGPQYLTELHDASYAVCDYRGNSHHYRDSVGP